MGRHGGKKQRFNPLIIGLSVAALVLVVGLGWWWWSLRSATDPVSADPVQAYATVTEAGPCTVAGSTTTVNMNTENGIVSATLKVCGYRADQSLLVEYLRSDPTQARVFGTSSAPKASFVQKLLPVAILLLGVIAAGAALAMLRERRKPRTEHPVSVAELRAAHLREGTVVAAQPLPEVQDSQMPTESDLGDVAPGAENESGSTSLVADDPAADETAGTPAQPTDSAFGPPDDSGAQPMSLTKVGSADTAPPPAEPAYGEDLFGSDHNADTDRR